MNKPKVLSPKAFVGSSIKTSVKVLEEFAASVVDLASKNGEYSPHLT